MCDLFPWRFVIMLVLVLTCRRISLRSTTSYGTMTASSFVWIMWKSPFGLVVRGSSVYLILIFSFLDATSATMFIIVVVCWLRWATLILVTIAIGLLSWFYSTRARSMSCHWSRLRMFSSISSGLGIPNGATECIKNYTCTFWPSAF